MEHLLAGLKSLLYCPNYVEARSIWIVNCWTHPTINHRYSSVSLTKCCHNSSFHLLQNVAYTSGKDWVAIQLAFKCKDQLFYPDIRPFKPFPSSSQSQSSSFHNRLATFKVENFDFVDSIIIPKASIIIADSYKEQS